MLSPDRAPIPLPDELIIRTVDSGVEFNVIIPNAPPTGAASSGGSGGTKKMKEQGRLFLTDQRVRTHNIVLFMYLIVLLTCRRDLLIPCFSYFCPAS